MSNKLVLTFFLLFSLTFVIYPTKKENTKLFDYCYSLEKILFRHQIHTKKNIPEKVQSIAKDVVNFGVSKTQGTLINKIIDQYKTSKNSVMIDIVPNQFYCLSGYWVEKLKPGIFEAIFYDKSKKIIIEFKDFKNEVDGLINEINSEYKTINEELKSIF